MSPLIVFDGNPQLSFGHMMDGVYVWRHVCGPPAPALMECIAAAGRLRLLVRWRTGRLVKVLFIFRCGYRNQVVVCGYPLCSSACATAVSCYRSVYTFIAEWLSIICKKSILSDVVGCCRCVTGVVEHTTSCGTHYVVYTCWLMCFIWVITSYRLC